jgi:all-trans-retinol 13,14-reductase
MSKKYDILIIGSGLGGLLTGNILGKKGYKVAIIEKNSYPGGCLQSFNIDGVTFDTGIHYVGGLKEGQVINKLFKYLDVFKDLKLRDLDPQGFDKFILGDKKFEFPVGYSNFQIKMEQYFPEEKKAIAEYLRKVKEVVDSVSLVNLMPTSFDGQDFYAKFAHGNLWQFMQSITDNTLLQHLLTAQNPLYAGTPETTFMFVHALIFNHYLEGPVRFVDGSKQLADALVTNLKKFGGEIFYKEHASEFQFSGDIIKYIKTTDGQEYYADRFISAIHPFPLMEMIDPVKIRKSYRKRIQSLNNTSSMFINYVVLKDGAVPYLNHNYYYYPDGNVWVLSTYDPNKFPQALSIFPIADSIDEKYTRGLSVLSYMNYDEVSKWENSRVGKRAEEYNDFKEEKSAKMIDELENVFPGIKKNIKSCTSATPLTLRDYTGTYRGSIYGIERNYQDPNRSLLFSKTKVPNLYMTGQNLNMHGMLGVAMGALVTSAEFCDLKKLLQEINDV